MPSHARPPDRTSRVVTSFTSRAGGRIVAQVTIVPSCTRVVAGATSPRPSGVELSALSAADLAAAVSGGGRPSDGAGLVQLSMLDAALAAVETVGDRRPRRVQPGS